MSDAPENLPSPNPAGSELEPEQSVPVDAQSLARHFEQDDVDARGVVRFGIVIAVGAVVAATVLAVVLRMWTAGPLPVRFQIPPAEVTPPAVPGPGLDAAPESNLESYFLREDERLYRYGWVDRDAGIVHIPIEEAMRLLVENGVPARDTDVPRFGLDRSFLLDSSGGLEPAGDESIDKGAGGESPSGDGAEDEDAEETPAEEATPTGEETPTGEATPASEETPESEDSGEEPGGVEAGGDSAGDEADGEGPSSGDVGDDGEGAPGSIEPDDEDASGEEPGGSQSGG